MMSDKGLNFFDECAAECVHLCPQEEQSTSLLPERTIKCRQLTP